MGNMEVRSYSLLLMQAGLEHAAWACSQRNLLMQPGLGTTVLNHCYRIRARWSQEAEKRKESYTEKSRATAQQIDDAKTKRLRVICSSPDGRGGDAGVAGLVLRPV